MSWATTTAIVLVKLGKAWDALRSKDSSKGSPNAIKNPILAQRCNITNVNITLTIVDGGPCGQGAHNPAIDLLSDWAEKFMNSQNGPPSSHR